jgi:hypothetical protein
VPKRGPLSLQYSPSIAVFPGLHPGLLDAARQAGARVIGYTPALRMITNRPARASENRRSLRCGISIRSIAQRERDVSGPAVSHPHIREIGQNRAKLPRNHLAASLSGKRAGKASIARADDYNIRRPRHRGAHVPFARRSLPPKRRLLQIAHSGILGKHR